MSKTLPQESAELPATSTNGASGRMSDSGPATFGPPLPAGESTKQVGDAQVIGALERKAELLQSVVDSLADGLVAVDQSGRFIQFNPAGEKILGRGLADKEVADLSEEYGLFLPDGKPRFPHDELPLVRAIRGFRSRDVEMIVRSEQIPEGKWLKVTAGPVKDEHGTVNGGVVLFRDETETKQMQQTLEAERQYLRHLIGVQDRDRRLTAYDLHDGIVQLMTGALLRLEACTSRDDAQVEAKRSDITTATQLLRDAIDEARRLVGGLSPPVIDDQGVVGAIEYLVSNHERKDGLEIAFTHRLENSRFPAVVEATIYRIVQEALNNIVRHAATKRAAVSLDERDHQLNLSIRDWGCGFEIDNRRERRYGLRGIQERTRLLNGSIRIKSEPGQGTSIEITLPTAHDCSDAEPYEASRSRCVPAAESGESVLRTT